MKTKTKLFGIRALFQQYKFKLFIKGSILPLILSLLVFVPIKLYSDKPIIELLEVVVDMVVSIIPCLLGFVLGGYALLIGFSNISIIGIQKNNEITLYQKISTVFSLSLLMQIFLLVFAVLTKLILKAKIYLDSSIQADAINLLVIILMLFGLIYVTLMIKDLVMSIFNFSQYQHYVINKKNEKNTKSENTTNHSN